MAVFSRPAVLAGAAAVAGVAAAVALWLMKKRAKKPDRCARLLAPVVPYIEGVMKAFARPFDAASAPDGYILLAVAENKLAWRDILKPRVEAAVRDLPDWTANYGQLSGRPELRQAVAAFLERRFLQNKKNVLDADDLVCVTGVAATLNAVFYAACAPGDRVLVPRPYYAAFVSDLRAFAECEVVPCDLDDLDGAYTPRVKALLLTNPHNPLGTVLSSSELRRLAAWCDAKGIHFVSDEIYALSVFRDEDARPFVSLAALDGFDSGRRHVVWGLSKDFGMSGLRFGVLASKNPTILAAAQSAALFSQVPGIAAHVATELLADGEFCDAYLRENARRLLRSCELVEKALDALDIAYVRPTAGIFLFFDLSFLLNNNTVDGKFTSDMDIYEALLADEYRLVLTPGSAQAAAEPGWFRICYAFVPVPVLEVALERLTAFVTRYRAMTK